MRTIKEMKAEIEEIKNTIQTTQLKKMQETKLRKRIKFLLTCILYIETHPDETFIKDQVKAVENKINLRMAGFDEDQFKNIAKRDFSKMKKLYEKEYEIPKLRNKVRTMRFLLK